MKKLTWNVKKNNNKETRILLSQLVQQLHLWLIITINWTSSMWNTVMIYFYHICMTHSNHNQSSVEVSYGQKLGELSCHATCRKEKRPHSFPSNHRLLNSKYISPSYASTVTQYWITGWQMKIWKVGIWEKKTGKLSGLSNKLQVTDRCWLKSCINSPSSMLET